MTNVSTKSAILQACITQQITLKLPKLQHNIRGVNRGAECHSEYKNIDTIMNTAAFMYTPCIDFAHRVPLNRQTVLKHLC